MWSGYRIIAVTGFDGRHALTTDGLFQIFEKGLDIMLYLTGSSLMLLLIGATTSLGSILVFQRKVKDNLLLFSLLGAFAVIGGIVLHGAPSEAYFPPLVVFGAVFLAYGIHVLPRFWRYFTLTVFLMASIMNVANIHSMIKIIPSIREKQEIADWIVQDAQGLPIELRSSDSGSKFETYLDGYRFLIRLHGGNLGGNGKLYKISEDNSNFVYEVKE